MSRFKDRALTVLSIGTLLFICCGKDQQNLFQINLFDYFDETRNIEMVRIPGGTFVMGSPKDLAYQIYMSPGGHVDTIYNFERPVHFTSISSFLMSNTEITQAQYQAVTGENPSRFRGSLDYPVEQVSWYDAVTFCNMLSEQQGLSQCYDQTYNCDFSADGFRLPTEAEWEYAARAGTTSEYYFAESSAAINQAVWYVDNSDNTTHPVARKMANGYGLYDTSGNVAEWTWDNHGLYSCGSEIDPKGAEFGYYKSVRGGSWAAVPDELRSAYRFAYPPDKKITLNGFRIARRL